MVKRTDSESSRNHIEGGVHAGRDVIIGDQYNYGLRDERIVQITQTANPEEFHKALVEIQTQIAQLKQRPELSPVQVRNIEAAELQVSIAVEEAQKSKPDGNVINQALVDAKETFDLLAGGIDAAVKLGTSIALLLGLVMKIFGG